MTIHIAYDDALLEWQLGEGHPTDPRRAQYVIGHLARMQAGIKVDAITRTVTDAELAEVHDLEYVERITRGVCGEWKGVRPDLGAAARHMFAGTAQLVDGILDGTVDVGFSPQGAKHHAQWDRSSGFCVFNDFAAAATRLAAAGERVLYFDTDAHHGDGVENLVGGSSPNIMTVSIHDSTIFPGTGDAQDSDALVYNYPLRRGAGDPELLGSAALALNIADEFDPTVVLFAIGADGYVTDPLSSLRYTLEGYKTLAILVGAFVHRHQAAILMGGAGGYLPTTKTPLVWATVVGRLAETLELLDKKDVHAS